MLSRLYNFIDNLYLIPLFIVTILLYSMIAFVEVNFDFRLWDIASRITYVSLMAAFLIFLAYSKVRSR